MRFFTLVTLLGLAFLPMFAQTAKPKKTASSKTTAKSPAAAKPKPKTVATTQKKPDEKAEWEKASAIADQPARVTALQKFNETFPKSAKRNDALELIAATRGEMGNEKIVAGDIDGAIALFKAAVTDAPKPMSDQLFTESLSKFPANLYFRGERASAFEIAKALEEKSEQNAGRLLSIAAFYMSVENGAEAKLVAEKAIVLEPNSSAAYQTLGLADRIDFQLDESAAAYAKALELEPESLAARRGLAEMKRSLAKPDEAVTLYREILDKDAVNLPAETGLILALFDAGKRSDAETELAKSLEANPGNVILLAGVAYWYAAHNESEKAVEFAQKSIAVDPRFIWSHIALARGLTVQKKPIEAEKVLLAARAYGNFPTLEYEIASARLAAGFYRDAAEELTKSFSVKDGVVHANLGGRVPADSKNFTELIGAERRASIFAPTAADDPENAARLAALLELKQELDSATPNADTAAKAADAFARGDDKMKVHRQIFAATQLLDKKIALPKVVELAKATLPNVEPGLDIPNAASAVLASELYESRSIAAARGEYVTVPNVSRFTLSAILRGRIEEISGWALYEMDNPTESVVRLKRAVSVLPVDSAWWRSSMWRLGSALAISGKGAEALDAYVKCYKSGAPDGVRYGVIESLYKRLNGNKDGLEARIGTKPASTVAVEPAAQKTEPNVAPEAKVETPVATRKEPEAAATPEVKNDPPKTDTVPPELVAQKVEPQPKPEVKVETPTTTTPEPTATATPEVKNDPPKPEPILPEPTPQKAEPTPRPEVKPETPEVKNEITKTEPPPAEIVALKTEPKPTPDVKIEPLSETKTAQLPTATPEVKIDAPKPDPSPNVTPEEKTITIKQIPPNPIANLVPDVSKTNGQKPNESVSVNKPGRVAKELFPPVIITIPQPETGKAETKEPGLKSEPPSTTTETKPSSDPKSAPAVEKKNETAVNTGESRPRFADAKPETTTEIKPCTITASEENLSLKNGGGGLAVIVGLDGEGELEGLTATSSSPKNVTVRRESIEGITARAIFVIRSISPKTGIYQIKFELPCGKKEILVKVK